MLVPVYLASCQGSCPQKGAEANHRYCKSRESEHAGIRKENLSSSSVSPEPLLAKFTILPSGKGKTLFQRSRFSQAGTKDELELRDSKSTTSTLSQKDSMY